MTAVLSPCAWCEKQANRKKLNFPLISKKLETIVRKEIQRQMKNELFANQKSVSFFKINFALRSKVCFSVSLNDFPFCLICYGAMTQVRRENSFTQRFSLRTASLSNQQIIRLISGSFHQFPKKSKR